MEISHETLQYLLARINALEKEEKRLSALVKFLEGTTRV
jgi:hypothetical protein